MALANINILRKDQQRHGNISETSKVLKLLKKQTDTVGVVYQGKHITLTEVDGSIEVKDVSENFSAHIAGQLVEHFQGLYDTVKAKLANA
jgi:hypothetical protein